MKNYDKEQMLAIEAHDGYFLVLAPPGCGKTDILSERVMRALNNGVSHEDILCLTFTNRASRGMKKRIMDMAGRQECQFFVGNIHRFCSNFLFQHALVPEHTGIIDDEDLAEILLTINPDFFRNKMGGIDRMKAAMVDNIDSYLSQRQMEHPKEAIFLPQEYEHFYDIAQEYHFRPEQVPPEQQLVKYTLQYRAYKQQHNLISFTDILILTYEALRQDKDHSFKRYRWIQVDEVQDLNALQMAIIDELTNTTETFTVMFLGDEQQAIFSFIGAKLGQLEMLREKCRGHVLTLGRNYRSPDYLLNIFNTYASEELGVPPELLPRATRNEPHDKLDLILTGNATSEDEEERISRMIRYYLSIGEQERLAILVPTNATADRISTRLQKEGFPHFKISGSDIFRSTSFKTLAAFFCICINPFNTLAWSRLLYGIGAVNSCSGARVLLAQMQGVMMTPLDLMDDASYVVRFNEAYTNREFVFFDTETTGLNVLTDDIVQIAAFKVKHGQRVEGSDFNIFLHTQQEIPAKLGTLDNPLLKAYAAHPHLEPEEGLKRFLDYIGDCPVLGHNVYYDYRILQHNVKRHLQRTITLEVYDSLHLVKCVEPKLRMYKLAFLLEKLQLEGQNSHLADEDVAATLALVEHCHHKSSAVSTLQDSFKAQPRVQFIIKQMNALKPLLKYMQMHLTQPTENKPALTNALKYIYQALLEQHLITPLGNKWDTFLRFVEHEWEKDTESELLAGRINSHVNDLMAGLSEGDLVNSTDLVAERIFIMTVHKGKGLEFENVIVLGANDGTYPYFVTNKVLAAPERHLPQDVHRAELDRMEDARKFYVALTRAKKRLCVSFSYCNTHGLRTRMTPFMISIRHLFYTGRQQ